MGSLSITGGNRVAKPFPFLFFSKSGDRFSGTIFWSTFDGRSSDP